MTYPVIRAQGPHEVKWDGESGSSVARQTTASRVIAKSKNAALKATPGVKAKDDDLAVFEKEDHVFAWFTGTFDGKKGTASGIEISLALFREAQRVEIAQYGRGFDGIFGFSQGAITSSLLSVLAAEGERAPISPRFAIFAGGAPFTVFEQDSEELFSRIAPIKIPSVHMIGTKDKTIDPSLSYQLEGLFDESTRVRISHPFGHIVPYDDASLAKLEAFLDGFYQS